MVATVFIAGTIIMAGIPAVTQEGNSLVTTNLPQGGLVTSDITATNQYSGTGSPLALAEWADSRNTTTGLSFIGTGTGTASIRLAEGWDGMHIYTYLYNLKDIESWTLNPATTYDGTQDTANHFPAPAGPTVWSYGEVQVTNNCQGWDDPGNYLFADLNPRLGGLGTYWDAGQTAYWQQPVNVPRGQISRMWVAFDYWAGTWDQDSDGTQDPFCPWDMVKIYANVGSAGNIANQAQRVIEISSTQIPNKNNAWNPTVLTAVPQTIIDAINSGSPTPANAVYLRVGILNSAAYNTNDYNGRTRFRNIRLFVEALAQPVQLNMRVSFDGVGGNGGAQNAIQNIGGTYGVGQLNYTAAPSRWLAGPVPLDINSTLRTDATVQFPGDNLETVKFDMYQIIYGTNQKNTVTAPNSMAPDGSVFTVGNGTTTTWNMNFNDYPPKISLAQNDYINYKFNGTKPSDWTFTSILDPTPGEKLASMIITGGTRFEMPPGPADVYGFWTFTATSPNYMQSVAVPSFVYEGQLLRINGTVISSTLTDGYVGQTQAELTIKFPNGTVWSSAYRRVTVTGARQITFGAITIPSSGLDYVAGTYTAIVTWNNTRSGLPLNETGCMVRTFIVRHRTTLAAANPVILDVLNTQTALPIQVRYADFGGAIVSGASVTFTNFDATLQTMTFVNDYYNYLTLLDCTNGPRGLNYFNITATHPAFETKSVIITVEIVRTSNFTTTNASVSTQWNSNFNLVFQYIDATNGSGIIIDSPNNLTVTGWPGGASRYTVDMSQAATGTYTVVFNSSNTMPYVSYPLTINIKKIGCQGKTLTTDVSITPRSSALNLVPIPDLAFGQTMIVNGNFKEVSSGALIIGATTTAQIIGFGACAVAAFPNGTYRYSFNTQSLPSTGTYTLRAVINWSGVPYYANQTQTLSIRVIQRQTQAYATNTFDVKYWGSNFSVPLYYLDVINGSAIGSLTNVRIQISAFDGATPLNQVNTLTGISYESGGYWNLTFNATHFGRTNLSPGFSVSVTIGWRPTAAPYYVNQSVAFTIKIDEAPTFIYIEDPSKQTVPSGNNHTITFTLINQRSGLGIAGQQGNIVVTSAGLLPDNEVFNPSIGITWNGLGNYTLMFNITKLASDYVAFNISINMNNYVDIVDYSFTLIKITPIPVTEVQPVAPVQLDEQANISVYFHLIGVSAGISDATVTLQRNPSSGLWPGGSYSYSFDGSMYYNILFTPSFTHPVVNASGSHSVFVNLASPSGNSQVRVNFVVNPIPTNISNTYFNGTDYTSTLPTYSTYIGDYVNVSVYFENTYNSTLVTGALVTISRAGFSQVMTMLGSTYNYVVSTSMFGVGSFEFTISASRNNFLQASQKIKLDIQPVSTDLVVELNNSAGLSFNMYYGESMVVAFLYNNTHRDVPIRSGSAMLTGGAVPFSNSTFSVNATGWWVGTITSAGIGIPGTYSMTLSVSLANYQTALETFVVTVYQIPTALASYNSTGQPQGGFSLYWGQTLTLAVRYTNTLTSAFITGASMSVTSTLVNSSFSASGSWYNYTFNTATVTPSVYTISISASRANHTSATALVTVTVLAIPTDLRVYDGNVQSTSYEAVFGQNVTFKLQLWDTLNDVVVTGTGFSSAYGHISPTGESGNYTLAVNTTSWAAIGIVQFTVTATRANHIASSEVITINIKPITTDVRVYINGVDRTSTLQETINFLETFTITVYYNNTLSSTPITGATVSIAFTNVTGSYSFPLAPGGGTGNYTRLFDSGNLGSAIGNQYAFDLSANRTNFESVFKRINIFYNPIPTALNVSHGGVDLPRSGPSNTVNVVYCDTLVLAVNLASYLQGINLSGPGVSITAVVNQRTLVGVYNGSAYVISVEVNNTLYAMNAGFTHQVLVVGDAQGYKSDSFSVLVNVLPIITNMSVFVNESYYTNILSATLFLKDQLAFKVYYERFYNGYQALSQFGAEVKLVFINDTTLAQTEIVLLPALLENYAAYDLVLDVNTFKAGLKDFYITASLANYETQQLKFSVNVNKINTTISVLVNGLGQDDIDTEHIQLGDRLDFSVRYFETGSLVPVQSASVLLRYTDDISQSLVSLPLTYNVSSGNFTTGAGGLVLDLSEFVAQLKIFTITAQLDSYEARTVSYLVNVQRIKINTLLATVNATNTTITVIPGAEVRLRINLYDSFSGLPFTDISSINVTVTPDFDLREIQMFPEPGNPGYFYVDITAPTTPNDPGRPAYKLVVRVTLAANPVLLQQYEFEVLKQFDLVVLPPIEGPNYLWLVYTLLIAVIVISLWFIAYQVRFKYPPMIRKIMDMRRAVARSKEASKIRPAKVMSREENIYNHFAKVINAFSFLQTRDTRYAAKTGGYAPTPDGETKLEWEITAIEAPEMPQVGAKGLKRAKGYVAPEAVAPVSAPAKPFTAPAAPVTPAAAPSAPLQPPAPGATPAPVTKPLAPAAGPAPVTKPMVKPPALAALPKPSVTPLKATRPGMPGVKPVPGAAPGAAVGESHENLYQQLVLLEQKRYKAERSLRDLEAKHSKGLISDDEHRSYQEKISGGLDKIKQQIADIRRKLISF
ncbi:MAG: hypothetical protein JW839_13315 [Candidatus Lokiarchaeota archaeon]|nr:hypothetical protein [Candidatus Lokiarchaeota archaeon]